ncbi:MAG: hypothetical protein A2015_02565 [Spirochaetes bacterium GWF1_31_7]|nr:MAG: hypothetical protein A2Y30_16060 [Spirochaetes bacterium GWE1_32_154]OHD47334.1 MAG: hypothetical protein A2Y29_16535 [Spirochaetes bacterium GWE2_31_10]OHD53187.1 MAG: hypothetical protein A2015_02565 [Spirochaetes bacterium GWF1_31_7]OHD78370.1 MAG: hypothetical protein A2355_01820 [Spirochaetes bacterium RIFOXYB1_FULL_32_8]HBD94998.1 hypothetical protein [Spirochaetia bacterium]
MDIENIEKRKIKSVQREIICKIENWGAEGVTIAHDNENKAILIRYAIPGELCRINIYKEAKDYALGEPVEILEKSEFRITPQCEYFSMCGGCDLQMINYKKQIDVKMNVIKESFRRIGGIDFEFTGLITSPNESYYRNTVTFKVNPKKNLIGFFRKDTKSIIDISECKIASGEINTALNKIRNSNISLPHNFKVRSTADGDTVVNMVKTDLYEDREVYETINACGRSLKFKISKDSFFQINNSVIPLWIEKIVSFLDDTKSERIFDLYCGIGLITLFVSFFAKETIGVEIAKSSVNDGNHNIKVNNITTNIKIIQSAVEDTIDELGYADVMIVDPPRKGLDEITRGVLLKMKPKKIIYSSCKASTMARDIKELSSLYSIQELIPVDMFPQTHHMEMLSLLVLK